MFEHEFVPDHEVLGCPSRSINISISYMDNLHARIRTTRIDNGLSQAGLAKQAGVSQPTVANWENGSHIPRRAALERIGQALGVEPDWLLSGDYARAHRSVQDYLSRPIRHVPVHKWPVTSQELQTKHPDGYLIYPTDSPHTVALLKPSSTSQGNQIYVVDQAISDPARTDIMLWDDGSHLTFATPSDRPDGAKPIGQLKAEIKTY